MQPIPPPDAKTETIDKHPYGFCRAGVLCVCPAVGQRKPDCPCMKYTLRVPGVRKMPIFAGAARRFCAKPEKHARGPRRCLCPVGKHVIVSLSKNICICCVHGEGIEVKNLERRFLLVDVSVLPEVFLKVVKGQGASGGGQREEMFRPLLRWPDLSRSAFYKYKDCILTRKNSKEVLTVNATLLDETGRCKACWRAFRRRARPSSPSTRPRRKTARHRWPCPSARAVCRARWRICWRS